MFAASLETSWTTTSRVSWNPKRYFICLYPNSQHQELRMLLPPFIIAADAIHHPRIHGLYARELKDHGYQFVSANSIFTQRWKKEIGENRQDKSIEWGNNIMNLNKFKNITNTYIFIDYMWEYLSQVTNYLPIITTFKLL